MGFVGNSRPMLNEAPNLNYLWASLIVEECVRNRVDFFSIAPGSRSAPLAIAVASGGPLEYCVHYDERGAAFHALGYAKSTGRPAVFVCSSGTALANALPAAIGAKLEAPHRQALAIAGDGGFHLNIQELQTLRHHNIDVSIVVMNNRSYGIIKQFPQKF